MKFTMYSKFSENVINHGIEKAADIAKGLGFCGIEMFAGEVSNAQNAIDNVNAASHARKVLESYGLSVACYSVYANIWNNPEGEKTLMKHIDIAAEMGSPYFHHTLLPWLSMWDGAPNYHDAVRDIVRAATNVANYAKTLGITCIYEDQGCYVNGVEGFRGFWEQIKQNCSNVGICGDLGNILFVNETPEEFLKVYAKDVCHVHVKDYLWKKAEVSPGLYWVGAEDGSWLRETMVGSGIVNFEACMKLLKQAGYNGYFSLENNHPEPYKEGVFQAMEYLRRYW